MFQSVAEEKNIEFEIVELDENITFGFDADRIDEVINNLLSNAFKFTPTGGEILLKLETCDITTNEQITKYSKITLRDSGIGIAAGDLDKVFERFFQSESTTTQVYGGSGIGLSLVKELVELHNGKISVTSEQFKWTEFTVLLPMIAGTESPAVEDYLPSSNMIESYEYEHEKQVSGKYKETVLVVEDNNDLRNYLDELLSKEYNVIASCNGTEGIESALKNNPDIIISDVMMPEMDGYQLTSTLKDNINTSHIPIILLTAKGGRESKIEGLQKGAEDYITKPFDEEEILLKIKNIFINRKKMQEKYRKQIIANPSDIKVQSMDEQFLVKLTGIIEKNISNPQLNVDFICSEMIFSRPQLYRKLKALTDLSINQFVRSIRLKRAAQLIKQNSGTISEIAYNTGFENLSYFSKKFKEEFGILPSEYNPD